MFWLDLVWNQFRQDNVSQAIYSIPKNLSFQGLVMSSGSCSGPGVCGGARRRPPPPPEPALSLAADLSELSLDQGYHTLADCGPPRRRRDNTLNDALWLKILSYLEVGWVFVNYFIH